MYQHLAHGISLYSGKTRAYLRYKKIPFVERLSSADYANIEQHVGRKIIPVVVTPEGEYIQDTTVIIDRLEQRFPTPSVYPDRPWQKLVALLLEVYGDEWLLLAAMHYRWHFKRQNLWFVLNQFGDVIKPRWPGWAKPLVAIPAALYFGRMYRPLMGLTAQTEPELEKATETFLRDFDRHLQDHDFLLGSRPSIGDFGLVAPLHAHMAQDPYPKQWLQDIAPRVFDWTRRMQNPPGEAGHFLPDDAVPETLYPILGHMFRQQFPMLSATLKKVAEWVAEHPDADHFPRTIGRHDFMLGSAQASRAILPYQQWMFQRPLRHYQGLAAGDKARIDPILKQLGGFDGLQQPIPVALDYINHRLTVASFF
ncbi:MAG: glutathione S-transferase [Alphaproteobacteria bacterium]|nr:glutathione S-transferase [Alphaproteobacteria bacterium]